MSAIRTWFEEQMRRGRAAQPSANGFPLAATVVTDDQAPAAAREARDYYKDACFDFGGAWIHRQQIGAGDVFFVHVGTDGDDGALEIFDANGKLLDAAFVVGQDIVWEEQADVRSRFEKEDE